MAMTTATWVIGPATTSAGPIARRYRGRISAARPRLAPAAVRTLAVCLVALVLAATAGVAVTVVEPSVVAPTGTTPVELTGGASAADDHGGGFVSTSPSGEEAVARPATRAVALRTSVLRLLVVVVLVAFGTTLSRLRASRRRLARAGWRPASSWRSGLPRRGPPALLTH